MLTLKRLFFIRRFSSNSFFAVFDSSNVSPFIYLTLSNRNFIGYLSSVPYSLHNLIYGPFARLQFFIILPQLPTNMRCACKPVSFSWSRHSNAYAYSCDCFPTDYFLNYLQGGPLGNLVFVKLIVTKTKLVPRFLHSLLNGTLSHIDLSC